MLMMLLSLGLQAQEEHNVIYDQPDGELRIYNRQGYVVNQNEETGEISVRQQAGTISIVYAPDGQHVYLQDPVSTYTYGGSWVEGTLSADGRSLSVPTGQYVDYTRSFDLGYQMQVLDYDAATDAYVVDSDCTEIVYTIGDDGIRLSGTSQQRIVGLIIRTFGNPQGSAIGQDFAYLNGVWLGSGDFESVYTEADFEVQQPPFGLPTTACYLTTARYDGAEYLPYEGRTNVGLDEDVETLWIQGVTDLMPSAWVKGLRDGDGTVTLKSGQFLGTIDGIPLYLHGARLGSDNSFTIKDIELQPTADGYRTTDFVFVTVSETALEYVLFYMGMTIANHPDALVEVPAGLATETYTLTCRESASAPVDSREVTAAADGDAFYVKGVWPQLPEAWVEGRIEGSQIVFTLPQYLGKFESDEVDYPMFFTAFDAQTGELLPSLTFSYDAQAGKLSDVSAPVSIGINKTGYLSVQDYFDLQLTRVKDTSTIVSTPDVAKATGATFHDLQGRRHQQPVRGINIVNGKKILKR